MRVEESRKSWRNLVIDKIFEVREDVLDRVNEGHKIDDSWLLVQSPASGAEAGSLELDSVDVLELVCLIEDELGMEVDLTGENFRNVRSIGDIVDLLMDLDPSCSRV